MHGFASKMVKPRDRAKGTTANNAATHRHLGIARGQGVVCTGAPPGERQPATAAEPHLLWVAGSLALCRTMRHLVLPPAWMWFCDETKEL